MGEKGSGLAAENATLNHRQTGSRLASNARNKQEVARPGAGAREPGVGFDPAGDLHADHQRPAHGVAANECDVVFVRQLEQTSRKTIEPLLVGPRQRQ